jgi:glycosyltransferase involved in cell wall biosynthesis
MLVADDNIDRRVLVQARSLARAGVRTTVIAVPHAGDVDLDARDFPEVAIVRIDPGVPIERPLNISRTRLSDLPVAPKDVYSYFEEFAQMALQHPAAIFVAHDLPVLASAIAAADHLGAKVFYDAHELYPEQHHFGEERIQLYRNAEAAFIPFAETVTTVNQSIAEEMRVRYGIATPGVILNTPDTGAAPVPLARTDLLRQALSLGPDKVILLFQGSLSLNRNLENLVRAMEHVTSEDVVLVLMGPGDAKRAELTQIAKELALLNQRVFFHPAVPQSLLLAYTASVDFGIIPYPDIDFNTLYCTPNKLFEFMAAGLPILANDLPELRRFVVETGIGITHAMTDPRSIAAGIDRMRLADRELFRSALIALAPKMTWAAQEADYLRMFGRRSPGNALAATKPA